VSSAIKAKQAAKTAEKVKSSSIGPIRGSVLKERVNLNCIDEARPTRKNDTPTFTSKESMMSPIKEELMVRPVPLPIQTEAFSYSRFGISSQPSKPLKAARDELKFGLETPIKNSARNMRAIETVEDSQETTTTSKKSVIEAEPDCQMTSEEERLYGKRFMLGYEKIKLLGKGGQGLVWLAKRKKDDELVAVKQIALGGFFNEKTSKKEIEINDLIFNTDDKGDNLTMMGKNCLIQVTDYSQTRKDLFMVLELAGQCLSKHVYSMKGEFMKSERIYKVFWQLT